MPMAVLQLILYIGVTGEGVRGYVKSMGDRLGRWEEAKGGNRWHWIQSKMERHIPLVQWRVQDS